MKRFRHSQKDSFPRIAVWIYTKPGGTVLIDLGCLFSEIHSIMADEPITEARLEEFAEVSYPHAEKKAVRSAQAWTPLGLQK